MYWLRTDNLLDVVTWLVLGALWWTGGWLLSTHAFRLRSQERLLTGLAAGLILFITLSNVLAHLVSLPAALWGGAILVLGMGLASTWRSPQRPYLQTSDLRAWPGLLVLAGLTAVFALINRGLAIFDDYHNLPLVSVMASGDVPPHYFLRTDTRLAYHYGLHLFAAGLVRLGDFTPWSSYDLSKAFSLGLSLVLSGMWFRRVTRSALAGSLGALAVGLGGGTRWLLIAIPTGWMQRMSGGLHLLGSAAQSGPDLPTNLTRPWAIGGGSLLPFPFAVANGIFPPQVMALGGAAALPVVTLVLLVYLARRGRGIWSGLALSLILASLALTAEHLFLLFWGGLALAWLIAALRRGLNRQSRGWPVILALSAALALGTGGVLTEMARRLVIELGGGTAASGAGFTGFALRWPPAIVSAHLGALSFSEPGQILIALAEMGPVLILGLWVSPWAWKRLRRGDELSSGLGIAAMVGFTVPLFVVYVARDRDIVRLTSSALLIWLLLGFPLAFNAFRAGTNRVRALLGTGYSVTILGGVVLLAVQLSAIPRPQFTNFVQAQDAMLSRDYWNRLDAGSQILDRVPYRAITLFGRGGGQAYQDLYQPLASWEALVADPDPIRLARSGYTYVYIDQKWWQRMTPEQRQAFQQPCVTVVAEAGSGGSAFRRLLDIQTCRGGS